MLPSNIQTEARRDERIRLFYTKLGQLCLYPPGQPPPPPLMQRHRYKHAAVWN